MMIAEHEKMMMEKLEKFEQQEQFNRSSTREQQNEDDIDDAVVSCDKSMALNELEANDEHYNTPPLVGSLSTDSPIIHYDTLQPEGALQLVSGSLPIKLEKYLVSQFDDLCPPLQTSTRLEMKALRAIFSIGIDAVCIQSDILANIDPLILSSKDFITANDTNELFGEFQIPPPPE